MLVMPMCDLIECKRFKIDPHLLKTAFKLSVTDKKLLENCTYYKEFRKKAV